MSTVIMLALCAACVGDTWSFCSFELIVSMLLLACVAVLRSALSVLHFLVNVFDS